jgi:hypothetical protein
VRSRNAEPLDVIRGAIIELERNAHPAHCVLAALWLVLVVAVQLRSPAVGLFLSILPLGLCVSMVLVPNWCLLPIEPRTPAPRPWRDSIFRRPLARYPTIDTAFDELERGRTLASYLVLAASALGWTLLRTIGTNATLAHAALAVAAVSCGLVAGLSFTGRRKLIDELNADAASIPAELDRYARGVYAHPDDI